MLHLGNTLRQLLLSLRGPHHAVARYEAPRDLDGLGVAFVLTLKAQPKVPATWFKTTLAAMRRGAVVPQDLAHHESSVFVDWQKLLATADPAVSSGLRIHALRILHCLADVIEPYDTVLAHDVRVLPTAFYLRDALPVFTTVGTAERIGVHVRELVANTAAMTAMFKALAVALRPVRSRDNEAVLAWCHFCERRRSRACPRCVENRRTLRYTMLFEYASMLQREKLLAMVPDPVALTAPLYRPTDLWGRETQFIHDGRETEGVYRLYPSRHFGEQRLVDFTQLLRYLVASGRPSPLLAARTPGEMDDFDGAGYRARLIYSKATDGETFAERTTPILDIAKAAGCSWSDDSKHPFELFSATAIRRYMGATRKGIEASRKGRRPVIGVTRALRAPRIAALPYTDPDGDTYTIEIVHRRAKGGRAPVFYVTLPYSVPDPVRAAKDLLDVQAASIAYSSSCWQVAGRWFWAVPAVRRHANLCVRGANDVATEEFLYPDAADFVRWLDIEIPALSLKRFNRLLYDQKYANRVQSVLRGESIHIGRFTAHEDVILQTFAQGRAPGRVSAAESGQLLAQLPQRSMHGVRRRLEELGKALAFREGFRAYSQSGYCLSYASKRRKRWTKEGCRQ